ncbi:MAG: HlyD family efflux transporter periplasmic adaptor subunit [Cyanobacteria bacterium MAG CAR1_bin_15]|nr:HlyD family efflux transporter periplasmic adaptor subunit [Cyanobacteria bacterium MAG CAR1_bin_15]
MEIRQGLRLIGIVLAVLVTGLLVVRVLRPQGGAQSPPAATAPQAGEGDGAAPRPVARHVAALGYIEPRGQVRRLAGINNGSGSARVDQLLVREGDPVVQGQVLAVFDGIPRLRAERQVLQAEIESLARQLEVSRSEEKRYAHLAATGAVSHDNLDERRRSTEKLAGDLATARAELQVVDADLENGVLRSPMAGTVLEILSREGERPGDSAVLELGQTDFMEVVAEVYETDISRIRPGQQAIITSEHGGFTGALSGQVREISRQVNRRDVFSSDPADAVDARVVEVRIALAPASSQRVRNLTRMQVLVRVDTESDLPG